MPEQELNSLARQAKEYGGTLILRGFKDNRLSETKAAALKLNASGASWKIHPQLFKTFSVNQVPAIVVASDASNQLLANGCAPDTAFTSIYGAQSIEMSLRKIVEQSNQREIVKISQNKLNFYYSNAR
jgi:conjugal transfer pilus assembly protein TrbC